MKNAIFVMGLLALVMASNADANYKIRCPEIPCDNYSTRADGSYECLWAFISSRYDVSTTNVNNERFQRQLNREMLVSRLYNRAVQSGELDTYTDHETFVSLTICRVDGMRSRDVLAELQNTSMPSISRDKGGILEGIIGPGSGHDEP